MKEPYRRIYAEVHLDRIIKNIEAMKAALPPETKLIGVVKADAYGHGAVPVARAIAPYVWGYAVADAGEGISLRKNGVTKPILILGSTHHSVFQEVISYELRPAVFELSRAQKLSERALSAGKKVKVHLAVDTGMSRIGLMPDENGVREAAAIAALPGIEAEGIFTHFARADEGTDEYAAEQYRKFTWFTEELARLGVKIPICHCANSAAIMELPQFSMDAARCGISMYGIYPSDAVSREMKLCPAMEIRSFITYIKEIEAGTPVSYGGTFTAKKRMRVATICAGYGDGYPRGLSGKGYVLINGKKAPILGRVCMDQFMADVTEIPEACEDMRVTLQGFDGDAFLSMEELGDLSGRFHYEIPCILGKRVPRVYMKNGRIVGTKDYSDDSFPYFD